MPLFGELELGTVTGALPELRDLDTEAWELPKAEILQLACEIDDGSRALLPRDPKVQLAYTMYVDHRWTVDELCATLHISRATCYRYVALARRAVPEG